jgi:hypothetical protein
MRSNAVQKFLAANHYSKPLYIITGLKTASGAKLSQGKPNDVHVGPDIPIHGMAAGITVTV